MEIRIITDKITIEDLRKIAENQFGGVVKAVVDIENESMAIGGELHADEEAMLLDQGSKQENLWGINLRLESSGNDFIEFDSMINMRPSQGNRSRGVEDEGARKKIIEIVNKLINRETENSPLSK